MSVAPISIRESSNITFWASPGSLEETHAGSVDISRRMSSMVCMPNSPNTIK